MAPYLGPSLATAVRQVQAGEVPYALGAGVPSMEVRRDGSGWTLLDLEGGAGFGVAPGSMQPIVDGKVHVRGATAIDVCIALVARWDESSHGEALRDGESLTVRFRGETGKDRALLKGMRKALGVGIMEAQAVIQGGRWSSAELKKMREVLKALRGSGATVDAIEVNPPGASARAPRR